MIDPNLFRMITVLPSLEWQLESQEYREDFSVRYFQSVVSPVLKIRVAFRVAVCIPVLCSLMI